MELNRIPEYQLEEERVLKEVNANAYLLRHKKSGARIFLLENDDNNKVFTIAFRTPPKDSTGTPHILEHSVLCGSDKYPSKDPFVELVKGSLNTFLNAMTYPDKTMYPVASCNDKDFQNLMSVYMDAVFHPNIYKNEKLFRQEGWHFELESEESDLIYNGVVYNEMKGAFSSPEEVMGRYNKQLLFPHTPYAFESGGDPEVIPDLSYEDFLDFHKKYYHPSNSYIYLYGDMDMEEKLIWMDREYLSKYDAMEVDSAIPMEPAFSSMRQETICYGITDSESEEEGAYLSWSKVAGSELEPKKYLAFQILEYALLNAPGAPLKKALLDAGIGKDIFGGYDGELLQPTFTIASKSARPEQKETFIFVIESVLKEQVEKGLNKRSLLAGLNNCEFRCREADYGRFPKGLMYGLQAFESWIYDDKAPMIHLAYDETFAFLREAVNTRYFEELIQEELLTNQHGVILTVLPKKGYMKEMEEKTARKLAEYKASLTQEQIRELIRQTRELKEFQDAPSTEEELEAIPMLDVSDIRKEASPIINEERKIGEIPMLFHPVFTGEIGYLDVVFRADGVEMEDLPYLALLKSILGFVDTENHTYQELADEINIHTGGIGCLLSHYTHIQDPANPFTVFSIQGKALYQKLENMTKLMEEIINETKLEDDKRLAEIVGQLRSRAQTRLISGGHSAAVNRCISYFEPEAYLGEMTGGIGYYHFLEELDQNFQDKKDEMKERLKKVMGQVFNRENLLISYTADEQGYEAMLPCIKKLVDRLPHGEKNKAERIYPNERKNEGFQTASQVQYVARCGNFKTGGFSYTGAMKILQVIMNYDYLWIQLRVKGGAYGCMSGLSRDGEGYFVSYRDPNLRQTNEVYDKIPEYLRTFTVSERDMTKYIIGTISDMDTPLTPSGKGTRGLNAFLSGVTYEMLQKERNEVLHANQDAIRALAEPVEEILKQNYLCVVGNERKIAEDETLFGKVVQLFHNGAESILEEE